MTRPHFSAWGAQLSVASWNCNPVGSSSFYTTDDPHTHRRFPDNDLEPIFWIHFIKKKKKEQYQLVRSTAGSRKT
jgi:hypothetical protein